MSVITLKNKELTVKIKSFGAELTSIMTNDGKEHLWQGDPQFWRDQAPILFPIVSGLENDSYSLNGKTYTMPKHGFAKLKEFEVEASSEDSATFLLRADEETLKCYPFDFEFRATYKLIGKSLEVTYTTKNLGKETLYYSAGSHEGFACPGGIENYSIVFDEAETLDKYEVSATTGGIDETPVKFLNNEREIKLKKTLFAVDALIFFDVKSRGVSLRDDRTGSSIHVSYPDFNTLLVWTCPGGNGEYVCIEPWAGAPDLSWKKVDDFSKKYRIIPVLAGEESALVHTISF